MAKNKNTPRYEKNVLVLNVSKDKIKSFFKHDKIENVNHCNPYSEKGAGKTVCNGIVSVSNN